MLAGFENEVLKLPWVGIWRKFSQLFGGYLHCLPLVRFFFAHKELDHILRQQPFTVGLVHSPCLRIRWRAVVDLTLLQHIPLAVFIEILENERFEFADIIRTAKPNPSSSEFPDFIFDNGFIEHFQITSSQVTRKGATHARKESDFRRKVDTETEKLKTEWNITPSFDAVRSESWAFQNPAHSHEYLMDSFKQNWESHISSSKRFSDEKSIGIKKFSLRSRRQ